MDNTEQLTIKHLAPYLPYKLKVMSIYNDRVEILESLYNSRTEACLYHRHESLGSDYSFEEFKPLMHSLDRLTKEIEVNGERVVPIVELKEIYNSFPDCFIQKLEYHNLHGQFTLYGLEENDSYEVSMPLCIYQKLYEWHFAIDIPEHLYVNINTLQK